jgi:predicted phage tail protein
MAKRGSIVMLPDEVRSWLDKALTEGNFSGYQQLEELLKERGFDIGKSSIHRYGQKLESKLSAIKASTQAALAIAEAAPDDADLLNQSVMQMVQTEVFNSLVALQEANSEDDPAKRLRMMTGAAKGIAELSRASINIKKHKLEVQDKAKTAAQVIGEKARKGGLTEQAIREIEEQILGIAR